MRASWLRNVVAPLVLTLGLGFVTEARGAILLDVAQPSGAEAPWTLDPNNDNVGEGEFSLNFGDLSLTFEEFAPFDVVYVVQNSDGVSEYDLTGNLRNNTDREWGGVRIQLGFGTEDAFTVSELPGLDFDLPHQDSPVTLSLGSQVLDPDTHEATLLEWLDMTVLIGNAPAYRYHLDVPDSDSAFIPAGALTSDGYHLTVRYTPLPVPEPGSLAILALAAALLGGRSSRRRRHRCAMAVGHGGVNDS